MIVSVNASGTASMSLDCPTDMIAPIGGCTAGSDGHHYGPAMQPATSILPVGRALARGAPTCLRTASLPRPIRPKTPLDTDGHIVFYQHECHPAYEVLSYRKVRGFSRRAEPGCMGKSRGPRAAKLGALLPPKVNFHKVLKQLFSRADAATALWEFQAVSLRTC